MKASLKLLGFMVLVITLSTSWSVTSLIVNVPDDYQRVASSDIYDVSNHYGSDFLFCEDDDTLNNQKLRCSTLLVENHFFSSLRCNLNNNFILRIWQPPKLA
jgi:hypothetical protein